MLNLLDVRARNACSEISTRHGVGIWRSQEPSYIDFPVFDSYHLQSGGSDNATHAARAARFQTPGHPFAVSRIRNPSVSVHHQTRIILGQGIQNNSLNPTPPKYDGDGGCVDDGGVNTFPNPAKTYEHGMAVRGVGKPVTDPTRQVRSQSRLGWQGMPSSLRRRADQCRCGLHLIRPRFPTRGPSHSAGTLITSRPRAIEYYLTFPQAGKGIRIVLNRSGRQNILKNQRADKIGHLSHPSSSGLFQAPGRGGWPSKQRWRSE